MEKNPSSFIWDFKKELSNIYKHGVDFVTAAKAFKDPKRKIYIDSKHSRKEERFFCIGKIEDRVLTVRFTPTPRKPRLERGVGVYLPRWKDQDNRCRILEKRRTIL